MVILKKSSLCVVCMFLLMQNTRNFAANSVKNIDIYPFCLGLVHGACPLLLVPPFCIPALMAVYDNPNNLDTRELSFYKGIKTGFSVLIIVGIYLTLKINLFLVNCNKKA